MLTEPSKVLLPVSGVALASLVALAMLSADHFGITMLAALALAAFGGAVVLACLRDPLRDPLPATGSEAGGGGQPAAFGSGATARTAGGGAWALTAALALALAVISLVSSPLIGAAGAALGLVAMVGWLANVAGERAQRRVNLLPVGIPVVGFLAIASLMYLMSRILLAVPEQASTFIAMLVAVAVMATASFLALKPKVSSRAVMTGLAVAAVLMTGGGLVAASVGQRDIEAHGGEGHGGGIEIAAKDIAFDHTEIVLAANQDAVINFRNREALPHNVAIYDTEAAAREFFRGDIVVGPITTEYRFKSPAAGTYFFRCDVHPNMKGTVKVA